MKLELTTEEWEILRDIATELYCADKYNTIPNCYELSNKMIEILGE